MDTTRGATYRDVTFEPATAPVRQAERANGYDGAGPVDRWVRWPVYWTPVWVGALAALATALVIGLVGAALGANAATPGHRVLRYGDIGFGTLLFGVVGAFLAFVVGGWIAARIAGIRRAEPAMLHGGLTWLVTVPLLLLLVTFGGGSLFGGWYGGLAGTPAWVTPPVVTAPSTTTSGTGTVVRPAPSPSEPVAVDPDAARAARNSALGALTALLLGLIGGVIGGWMASGEPMTFTYYRTRATIRDGADVAPASAVPMPAARRPA